MECNLSVILSIDGEKVSNSSVMTSDFSLMRDLPDGKKPGFNLFRFSVLDGSSALDLRLWTSKLNLPLNIDPE